VIHELVMARGELTSLSDVAFSGTYVHKVVDYLSMYQWAIFSTYNFFKIQIYFYVCTLCATLMMMMMIV